MWSSKLHCAILFHVIVGAWLVEPEINNEITWCAAGEMEYKKCLDFMMAVLHSGEFVQQIRCKQAIDKEQCMSFIESGRADLVTLDPGEIFVAGRYNSLVPIMAECYGSNYDCVSGYYAVAVVRASFNTRSLLDLEGSKACFPGVGQMAGWVIPIGTLIDKDIIEVEDCNNLVKSAATFFGPSCAPNSLIDKYNPTGDNPRHMCELCGGEKGDHCSGSDPYANFHGAFKCLINGGDIAFLKHTTVDEEVVKASYHGPGKSNFKLLCPNGFTANIDSFASCNWGWVPAHAVVTSTAVLPKRRQNLQDFMARAAKIFEKRPPEHDDNRFESRRYNSRTSRNFVLFGSNEKYGNSLNLLFQDETILLKPIEQSRQTFVGYLGDTENYQQKLLKCPIPPARLCVISDQEMKKCQKMKTAFHAQLLKPDFVCVKAFSQTKCMQLITENSADLVVLDAGDIYHAGLKYDLMPIIAEQYDLQPEDLSYYVIAVAKQSDKDTDLLYLKGKRSCHTGIGMAAGWVVPMAFLLSNERMRSYGCDSARAAAEFFQKSCVPGALSREYTVGDWSYDTLCDLCHGTSSSFCSRSSQEPFFGHTGALQCLVEGGGEIAFVKHTTIRENTAGKNSHMWSRPMMPDDFELLCRDGTRAAYDQYANCNLGKVASNAIVTSKHKPPEHINAYIDLFMYAQQYYGSKYSDDFTFKMFVSQDGYSDLIFQDACQQLNVIPKEKRDYIEYLGNDFIQAMKMVDCSAACKSLVLSHYLVICVLFLFISSK